jgi:hypothetical protein
MTIEDFNQQITDCRMLNKSLNQTYNTTQPVIHKEMAYSISEHRKYFGMISKFTILKSFAKTKKFCRTVLP